MHTTHSTYVRAIVGVNLSKVHTEGSLYVNTKGYMDLLTVWQDSTPTIRVVHTCRVYGTWLVPTSRTAQHLATWSGVEPYTFLWYDLMINVHQP